MAFATGTAIGVTDPALIQVAANSGTTTALANGAVDNEAKTAITTAAAFAKITFTGQLAATGKASGAVIHVYRRDLAANGALNEDTPTVANRNTRIGTIRLPNSLASATQTVASINGAPLQGIDGKASEFYIENDTGQSISSGWTLKITPVSYNAQA